MDILEMLSREDKWFVGGGKASAYVPLFPRYKDKPGFPEDTWIVDKQLKTLFTIILLDHNGKEIELKLKNRLWRPDRVSLNFKASGLNITENKLCLPRDIFISNIKIKNTTKRPKKINLILWSIQHRYPQAEMKERSLNLEDYRMGNNYAAMNLRDKFGSVVNLALGANIPFSSFSWNLTDDHQNIMEYDNSMIGDKFKDGRFANEDKVNIDENLYGGVHLYLHYSVELEAKEETELNLGGALAIAPLKATEDLSLLQETDLLAKAEANWNEYFSSVPYFECSDEYIQNYYWYRWYGLKLNMVDLGLAYYKYPLVFEGTGGFRCHISYSAQCHILECNWMHNPRYAEGSILNMLNRQNEYGAIPGHIRLEHDSAHPENVDLSDDFHYGMYHTNWGRNILQVYYVNKNQEFLEKCYEPLVRYAERFMRIRDKEQVYLYDVLDHWETGQEFMPRYLQVDDQADAGKKIRFKGVDATYYMYELVKALAEIAKIIGKKEAEQNQWLELAEKIKKSMRKYMWNTKISMFCDVNSKTLKPYSAKAAVGFYPFISDDLVEKKHLRAIRKHLLNRNKFWTNWPVPTSSLDEPLTSTDAEWKGQRHGCTWNGRVWPMTNSHIAEALAQTAFRLDPRLKTRAVHFITKFIHLMFDQHNLKKPNCYEHYNPITGATSAYRGVNDYQHSWVNDLLVKYLIGLQPRKDNLLVIDPLPFKVKYFVMEHIRYRGYDIEVIYDKQTGLKVFVNGEQKGFADKLQRLEIPLE